MKDHPHRPESCLRSRVCHLSGWFVQCTRRTPLPFHLSRHKQGCHGRQWLLPRGPALRRCCRRTNALPHRASPEFQSIPRFERSCECNPGFWRPQEVVRFDIFPGGLSTQAFLSRQVLFPCVRSLQVRYLQFYNLSWFSCSYRSLIDGCRTCSLVFRGRHFNTGCRTQVPQFKKVCQPSVAVPSTNWPEPKPRTRYSKG